MTAGPAAFMAPLAATAVGSYPHTDARAACDLVLECFPEVPAWPQLPQLGLNEQMEIQFSEGLPCVVVDREKGRLYFDTSGDTSAALEKFYERILTDDVDAFAVSPDYSLGLHEIGQRLAGADRSRIRYMKMQVTGPVSFGLTIVDEKKRAIYYNEMFRDVVVKAIAMKARWQLRRFAAVCARRICFIDEPILSAFGSSTYVSVHRADVVALLREVADAIHAEGGLAGIHCCGNTEWTIPIDAGVDIVNFDAYGYGDSILLYADRVREFLRKGGVLAWGIVPTSEQIGGETAGSLADRIEDLARRLAGDQDSGLFFRNALVTASCGTGSIPLERAEKVTRLTKAVSDLLKEMHG